MFKNKTILITGGTRGIGKATAITFANSGAEKLILLYKSNEMSALETAEEINKLNSKCLCELVKCDISNAEEINKLYSYIINKYEKIDILVNNAGIAIDKDFYDRTIEDFYKTFQTNLFSMFLLCQKFGKIMYDNKCGKIVNISSTNGINAFFPTSIDYDASKAGVISLTHNLAIQFAPYVNVNSVAPGWVNTDMNTDLPKDLIESECEKIYLKRFAEPEEIANLILFLASDKASYMNGETIKIDGGY